MHRLTCPRTYYEGNNMRGDWILSEGYSLLILKHLSEGAGTSWNFLWGWRCWQEHSPSPLLEQAGAYRYGLHPLTSQVFPGLTNAVDVPLSQRFSTALLKLVGKHSTHKGCLLITWLQWPEGLVFLDPTGL